ncbi:MAG: hypothetical protein IH987_17760 [Planctomycetes bacterium]|nr:hypothetical protein [Planctomycetota bacterium]
MERPVKTLQQRLSIARRRGHDSDQPVDLITDDLLNEPRNACIDADEVMKLAEAFRLAGSDCEEYGRVGTMARRVRSLTRMAKDDSAPSTSRLEAICKLRDLWRLPGAIAHRSFVVEQFWRGGDWSGGKLLDDSFRKMKFGV